MEYMALDSSLSQLPGVLYETENDTDIWIPSNQEDSTSFKRQTSTSTSSDGQQFTNNRHGDQIKRSRSYSNLGVSFTWSTQTITVFVLWYIFSFLTLFFNKYILMDERNDPVVLGSCQLLMCIIGGLFHTKIPLGMIVTTPNARDQPMRSPHQGIRRFISRRLSKLVILVGCLRFSTLLFGLIALWYAPVSFAETVKSSAPVFTVILTRIVLGEVSSFLTIISLIPVVFGLVICSAYELSFTIPALIAALATNMSECLQNVFSKKLLVSDRSLDPHHLQLLTSISSLVIQIPSLLFLVDLSKLYETISSDSNLILSYVLNGVSFHCQSLSEYMLLSQISPVTHSVANTTKRALLILLSVVTFGNVVTVQSWLGTGIVFLGVYLYNKARAIQDATSHRRKDGDDVRPLMTTSSMNDSV